MNSKGIFFLLLIMFSGLAGYSQISLDPERTILNRIESNKWGKAERSVNRLLRKDSLNAEAWYVRSELFLSPDFSDYDIDSAHHYLLRAEEIYSIVDDREKERMARLPLDSVILLIQHRTIDSLAFEQAKEYNTEEVYNLFLVNYPLASQYAAAVELRDEVAFLEALKMNTMGSYQAYLAKYPASSRAEEATMRYEKLLYESRTADQKLESFVAFLGDYPQTPFRREIEKNVFEITTASGRPEPFRDFVEKYPNSAFRKKAEAIYYHLLGKAESQSFYSDSLKNVIALERGYWIPLMINNEFGFMNDRGEEMIEPQFASVSEDYLCGNIESAFLTLPDGILARDGTWIYIEDFQSVEDLGGGFLKIRTEKGDNIIHKSGFALVDHPVQNARLILSHFVALQVDGRWGLVSFTGKRLLSFEWEDIYALDEIIVLGRSGKKVVTGVDEIARLADGHKLPESLVFDDIRWVAHDWYTVRNGGLEGVLNAELEFIIPLDRQVLTRAPIGFVRERNRRMQTVGVAPAIDNRDFTEVRFYGDWIKLMNENGINLYDWKSNKLVASGADSLWFANRMAFTRLKDSIQVHFPTGGSIGFSAESPMIFIKSPDSIAHFYTLERNQKVVYAIQSGAQLFTTTADEIEYLGYGVFLITAKGKKGLVGDDGKTLLASEYTAIIRSGDQFTSVLKEGKFGFYDLRSKALITSDYERNLKVFNDTLLIAYKNGAYGFINWEEDSVSRFEFEEIRNWNDTSALVKKDFRWLVYGLKSRRTYGRGISSYSILADSSDEIVLKIFQDNYYGVLSNRRGEVIPSSFTFINNVGNPDNPFYFTEKYIEEAELYIVIYYDAEGQQLRREIYEEDEYDLIRCD